MQPDVFRNALISLYGPHGYISKFAKRIGRRRQTVHRWLRGEYKIPLMAMQVLVLLLREKRRNDDTTGTSQS
jgi:hypothetical protein